MEKRSATPRAGLLGILVLVTSLGLAAGVVHWATQTGHKPPALQRDALEHIASPSGGVDADLDPTSLAQMETFWTNRLTYPTGRFNPAWLLQAATQDAQVARGVPAGQVIYDRSRSRSPLSLDPSRFTSLGPQPVTSFGENWSGRVNAIAIDPVTPNVAYLAVNGGGIWKSTTCCTPTMTWAPATDDPAISIIGVDDVVIDPNNHNVVYAGTGDLNFTIPEYPSAGILKSTDQGVTWTVIGASAFAPPFPEPPNTYPQDQAVGKVRVDPRNSNHLVAGTATGVFFSYDAGASWSGPCYTNAYTSTQRQDTTGLLLRDNGSGTDLYVAVGTRAFSVTIHPVMSENGADGIYQATLPASGCPASWSLISRPDNGWPAGTGSGVPHHSGGNNVGRIDLAFAPSTIAPGSPNVTLYAQAQSATTLGQLGLWRSTDGGASWQQRSNVSALGGCGFDWPQNWFDQGLLVDPRAPDTVYMDTFEVWKSTDGGTTFTDLTCSYNGGLVHPDQHALAFKPGAPTTLLAGADGGSYISTDAGATWSDLNSSLSTLEFYGGDITGDFANSAAPGAIGGTQDNGSMANVWAGTPGPAVWSGVVGGDGFWSRVEPVQGQRWYAEINGQGFRHILMSSSGPFGFYSDISGSWAGLRGNFILPYELYKYDCPPTGCTHMIVGINRVDESLTGDGSWITVSPVFTSYISQLNYAVSLSTTAILGLGNGQVQYGFGLGQGTMATWVNVSGNNAVLPNRVILDVATDPINPLVGYAAVAGFDENTPSTPGHVFQVTCSANCATFTWANKTGNLPDIPIESIIANPRYPQQVFAGSDWGLYYTNDITAASPTWQRFNAGLPNVMVYDMTIDQGFTTLALWTRSRGAFAWPLPAGPFPGTTTPSPTPVAGTTSPTRTATVHPTVTVPIEPTNTAGASATRTATPGVGTPCPVQFSDVDMNNPFYTYIRCLACRGIISGYSSVPPCAVAPCFLPGASVTRGQVSKMISNAAGFADAIPSTQHTFMDVPYGHPFWLYIERLVGHGAISGYSASPPCPAGQVPCFLPGNPVTRGQLAKIDAQAAAYSDPIPPTTQTFQDVPGSNPFWVYVERVRLHGVISGYTGDGATINPCTGLVETQLLLYFRPCNPSTRGQTSKVVANTFFPNCLTPARR